MLLQLESAILWLSPAQYLTLVVILLLLLGFSCFHSYRAFKQFRFIAATATSKIRSAAQGQVEIKGLAEWLPGDQILSPFSNSRCTWYHCSIERRQTSAERVTWTNISEDRSDHLFLLADDTGACIIDPENAQVIAESDRSWYGSSEQDKLKPPKSPSWLRFPGQGDYRFRERLIRPATTLYALGWFSSFYNNPADAWLNSQVELVIRQWKMQAGKYLGEYDLDKNGEIQKQEWEAIRIAARKQVLADIGRQSSARHVMACPRDNNLPFILSAQSEQELTSRRRSRAFIFGICTLVSFSLMALLFSIRDPISL